MRSTRCHHALLCMCGPLPVLRLSRDHCIALHCAAPQALPGRAQQVADGALTRRSKQHLGSRGRPRRIHRADLPRSLQQHAQGRAGARCCAQQALWRGETGPLLGGTIVASCVYDVCTVASPSQRWLCADLLCHCELTWFSAAQGSELYTHCQ